LRFCINFGKIVLSNMGFVFRFAELVSELLEYDVCYFYSSWAARELVSRGV